MLMRWGCPLCSLLLERVLRFGDNVCEVRTERKEREVVR